MIYTLVVDERRFRLGSFVEWALAAAVAAAGIWFVAAPIQGLWGSRDEIPMPLLAPASLPPGLPASATSVPVMLLLDGREVRQGDLRSKVDALLPDSLALGPPHVSVGDFGDRHTRGYLVDGTRFFIVCERTEPGGPMRVSGVYLP
jgi:hypothetical protein